jgi:hypothetical protein
MDGLDLFCRGRFNDEIKLVAGGAAFSLDFGHVIGIF